MVRGWSFSVWPASYGVGQAVSSGLPTAQKLLSCFTKRERHSIEWAWLARRSKQLSLRAKRGSGPGAWSEYERAIATLADGQGYALLDGNKVVSTHQTIAAAIKARAELEAEPEAPKRLIRRSYPRIGAPEQFDRTHVTQNWTTRRRQELVDVYLVAHQPSLAVRGGNVS